MIKADSSNLRLWLLAAIVLLLATSANGLYVDVSTSLQSRRSRSPSTQLKSSNFNDDASSKPVLVVGATGKVGQKVVQQLLGQNIAVRALVRNETKAAQLFSEHLSCKNDENKKSTLLELVVSDLGKADRASLDAAVQGCQSVVSVSGALRFSKLSDFLPWRIFQFDASQWCDDTSHPYFVNYQAQKILIDLAAEHQCSRFVRLTGLSSGYSPFNLVSMIFASVGSMTTRYQFALEQYLRNSKVPYVIIRPGGLAEEERVSGVLPMIGRFLSMLIGTLPTKL